MFFTVFAFIVAIGLLISFHELGHYWVARRAGVRVLRFSLGFGPVLWRRRDAHGTEWALSAIPLGGYVKMLDDPDGSAGSQEQAFNKKSLAWRSAIVAAGPLANFILAVVLYAALALWGSEEPLPQLAEPAPASAAALAGVRGADTILSVNGVAVSSWPQARWQLLEPLSLGQAFTLEVRQADSAARTLRLQAPPNDMQPDGPDPFALAGLRLAGAQPQIAEVIPDSPGAHAGLQAGDVVLGVGGLAQPEVREFVEYIQRHAAQDLALVVDRAGTQLSLNIRPEPQLDSQGARVGRIGTVLNGYRPSVLVRLGPVDSLASGLRRTFETSVLTLRMMGRMLLGQVSVKNISGPVSIADYAGQSARIGLASYLGFLALISISIGVLNLLPIPMLDGGHLFFYLLEAVRGGRPVSERARELASRLGLGLVLGFTTLAIFNDFTRLFSG